MDRLVAEGHGPRQPRCVSLDPSPELPTSPQERTSQLDRRELHAGLVEPQRDAARGENAACRSGPRHAVAALVVALVGHYRLQQVSLGARAPKAGRLACSGVLLAVAAASRHRTSAREQDIVGHSAACAPPSVGVVPQTWGASRHTGRPRSPPDMHERQANIAIVCASAHGNQGLSALERVAKARAAAAALAACRITVADTCLSVATDRLSPVPPGGLRPRMRGCQTPRHHPLHMASSKNLANLCCGAEDTASSAQCIADYTPTCSLHTNACAAGPASNAEAT